MSFNISIKSNGTDMLDRIPEGVDKALKAVAAEFPRRIRKPAKDAVQGAYPGAKAKHLSQAIGKSTVSGYNATQQYKGGVLPIKDFGLKPTRRPKGNKPYTLSTTIKGSRSFGGAGSPYFIGPGGQAYKRSGSGRLPIERLNTLSVPAMMDNAAKSALEQAVEEVLDKRTQHQLERFLK